MTAEDIRREILDAEDRPLKPVTVPWTDTKVFVRALSGNEYDDLIGTVETVSVRVMAKVLCRVLTDEDGQRIFRDADAQALASKHVQVLTDLFGECMRLSAIDETGRQEVEEAFSEAQDGEAASG